MLARLLVGATFELAGDGGGRDRKVRAVTIVALTSKGATTGVGARGISCGRCTGSVCGAGTGDWCRIFIGTVTVAALLFPKG